MLQGMGGPIRVAGKAYAPVATMPGLKQNPAFSDKALADIATFVRHSWGNRLPQVQAETFKQARQALEKREKIFDAQELLPDIQGLSWEERMLHAMASVSPQATPSAGRKVLVFSVTPGYKHEVIPGGQNHAPCARHPQRRLRAGHQR